MNCNIKGTAKKFKSHTIFHPFFTNTVQRVKNQIWIVSLIYFSELYLKSSWRNSVPDKLTGNPKNVFLSLHSMYAWYLHRSTFAHGDQNSLKEILKEEKIKTLTISISSSNWYEIIYKVQIWLWLCLSSLDLHRITEC